MFLPSVPSTLLHGVGVAVSWNPVTSTDLWCWGEYDGAWWVHSRRKENRNVVATPSGWRGSGGSVSNLHSATGQTQSSHAGNVHLVNEGAESGWVDPQSMNTGKWKPPHEYVLTVFVLNRFTPPRATACILLGALARWFERVVLGHCGEATASMSSKLPLSQLLSSWPMNRYVFTQVWLK